MNQCTHCELLGNHEGCKAAECGKHEDWIVREHKAEIRRLTALTLELYDARREIARLKAALGEGR